jgi:hypothetical protein
MKKSVKLKFCMIKSGSLKLDKGSPVANNYMIVQTAMLQLHKQFLRLILHYCIKI